MSIVDKLSKKERLVQKTLNIDDSLYERLQHLSDTKYDESISKIINLCILELGKTEDIKIYDREKEILVKHTVVFRESALNELKRLGKKYKLSMYRLVNIAISNAIDELEQEEIGPDA